MAYTIIVGNITDTSAVLEVTTTTAISGGADLGFKVREGGPSGTIVSSGTLSFPSGTEADDTVATTVTGLTQSTMYYVAEDNKAFSTTFTTKATGYDDPKTATQEQWQDLADRIKAKSDVVNYSTNEINTGTTWIDGAVIYKKTISFGALPNTATRMISHGITGLSRVVKIEGIASTASGNYTTLPFTQSDPSALCDLIIDATHISMTATDDRSAWNSSYVTVYYTKSS